MNIKMANVLFHRNTQIKLICNFYGDYSVFFSQFKTGEFSKQHEKILYSLQMKNYCVTHLNYKNVLEIKTCLVLLF